jgi:2'-5' RNA ligase
VSLRLFVALDPPEEARSALADWRDGVLAGKDAWRPVPGEYLHVTLAFLGHRPEEDVAPVIAALDALTLRSAQLRPAAVVSVPPRRPRLLALELEDPSGAAAELQGAVAGALARAGLFEPEERPFWPHITIARLQRRARPGAAPDEGSLPPAFRASRVVLYRSITAPTGARYEPLHTVSAAP